MSSLKPLMNAIHWFALVVVWFSTTSAGGGCGGMVWTNSRLRRSWPKPYHHARQPAGVVENHTTNSRSSMYCTFINVLWCPNCWWISILFNGKVIQPPVPYKNFVWHQWLKSHTTTGAIQKIYMGPVVLRQSYKIFVWHQWLYDFSTTGTIQNFCMAPVVVWLYHWKVWKFTNDSDTIKH